MKFAAYVAVSFITFLHIPLVLFCITVYMVVCFVCFYLILQITYSYCYVYVCFILGILFYCDVRVLFVCKCVLYYCHRVPTQLQLTNISYYIISLLLQEPTKVCISAGWIHSTRSSRLLSILILSSQLYVCVIQVVSLFRVFQSQPCMFVCFLLHVTWPAHLTHLSSMILIMFGEHWKLRNAALCDFLHPCHFFLLRPKCFPQYPVLKHLSLREKVSPSHFHILLFSL